MGKKTKLIVSNALETVSGYALVTFKEFIGMSVEEKSHFKEIRFIFPEDRDLFLIKERLVSDTGMVVVRTTDKKLFLINIKKYLKELSGIKQRHYMDKIVFMAA